MCLLCGVYIVLFFSNRLEWYRGQIVGEPFDDGGVQFYLLLRLDEIALLYRFPDAGQGLYAITGIETRGVDGMPVPGASGQPVIR